MPRKSSRIRLSSHSTCPYLAFSRKWFSTLSLHPRACRDNLSGGGSLPACTSLQSVALEISRYPHTRSGRNTGSPASIPFLLFCLFDESIFILHLELVQHFFSCTIPVQEARRERSGFFGKGTVYLPATKISIFESGETILKGSDITSNVIGRKYCVYEVS